MFHSMTGTQSILEDVSHYLQHHWVPMGVKSLQAALVHHTVFPRITLLHSSFPTHLHSH